MFKDSKENISLFKVFKMKSIYRQNEHIFSSYQFKFSYSFVIPIFYNPNIYFCWFLLYLFTFVVYVLLSRYPIVLHAHLFNPRNSKGPWRARRKRTMTHNRAITHDGSNDQ